MNTLQSRKSVMIFVLSFTIAFGCFLNLPAVAQTNEQVAKEVIAVAKAQWAAQSGKKPASVWMKNIADEYTEFNPDSPTRLDGKALNGRLGDALASGSGEFVVDEMVNEKVQVYGEVAILTYNYVGATKDKDGKVESNFAKSTRVYVKKDGKWMLVHANFASVN